MVRNCRIYATEVHIKILNNSTINTNIPKELLANSIVKQTYALDSYQKVNKIILKPATYDYYFNSLLKTPSVTEI